MTDLTLADLEALEKLEREATPEKWEAHAKWMNAETTVIAARFDEGLGIVFSIADNEIGTKIDAALIVALRNHARALIAAARVANAVAGWPCANKAALEPLGEGSTCRDHLRGMQWCVSCLARAALSRAANRDGGGT